MSDTLSRRLSMLTTILVVTGILLLARLASFQFQFDAAQYLQNGATNSYHVAREQIPDRGRIYDRNGELLAGNEMFYSIGVSPNLITDKRGVAQKLNAILGIEQGLLLTKLSADAPWVPITQDPVSTDVAQKIAKEDMVGVRLDPMPRRTYPQGALAGPVIGFVGGNGKGYVGVEGGLDHYLAGQIRFADESPIPFDVNPNSRPPPGDDVYLTIDRSLQYLAETALQDALQEYKAPSGSIIIMDPRNGEILAMASFPAFDPNHFNAKDVSADDLKNRAISDLYEPGSVFKIVTMSSALDSGKVTRDWTYMDTRSIIVGGRPIYNWDRVGHGSQGFDNVLIHSWNVGTTNAALTLGPKIFYDYLRDHWGVNARTGIDMEGEATGVLRQPGDTVWGDSFLATNSFGQGLQVTPLQMLCYVNTIANRGQMMQPHIVLKRIHGDQEIKSEPFAMRTPIKADTANQMRDIMVKVVTQGEADKAKVKGYTIAGKTGTAQLYNPEIQDYDPYLQEATFVGFVPADEPRVSILVKLDNIPNYASQTAAPVFAELVKRLVVLMNIPTDKQREQLRQQGGNTWGIAGAKP